jgi:hypothetical protein
MTGTRPCATSKGGDARALLDPGTFREIGTLVGGETSPPRHRLAELALRQRIPLVMLLEGAGYRAGDRSRARTPVAVVASQPGVLAGSIDADAANKAAHFIAVADAFHLPLLFLADTPGCCWAPGPSGPVCCAAALACSPPRRRPPPRSPPDPSARRTGSGRW